MATGGAAFMIDSHAHLYFDRFDEDRAAVLDRAWSVGVHAIVNVGVDLATSRAALILALGDERLFAAVGVHPTSEVADLDAELAGIEALAREGASRVVAIGEIGLDYYWKNIPPEKQRPRLERQLALSERLGLPVIFHCREALDELLETLERRQGRPRGVFHCFAGGRAEAERALAMGFYISFAGNVTYPRSSELREALAIVPPDRLLLETDAPFLAPQQHRGRRNEPGLVAQTLAFLAREKGLDIGSLEAASDAACRALFRLDG